MTTLYTKLIRLDSDAVEEQQLSFSSRTIIDDDAYAAEADSNELIGHLHKWKCGMQSVMNPQLISVKLAARPSSVGLLFTVKCQVQTHSKTIKTKNEIAMQADNNLV